MTELTEFLFPAPARRTVGGIVRWWESRRLAYNLFVGGAGLLSLGAINLITLIPPGFTEGGFPLAGCCRVRRDGERLLLGGACHRDRSSEALGREALAGGTCALPDGADIFGGSRPFSHPACHDRVGHPGLIRPLLERPNHTEEKLPVVVGPGAAEFRLRPHSPLDRRRSRSCHPVG